MIVTESFWTLLQDWNHWAFELVLMAIFDGLVGLLLWPWIKKIVAKHDCEEDCTTLEYRVKLLEQLLGLRQTPTLEEFNQRSVERMRG